MDALSEMITAFQRASYVQEIEFIMGPLAQSPRTQSAASELFYRLVDTDVSRLHGSGDEWFNLATSAIRARNYTSAEKIVAVAIDQLPVDVDLRCFWFSFCYSHRTITDARAARAELDSLGWGNTATYWRYWCYNAQFESLYLGDRDRAATLLDTALKVVPPADLHYVFRQYRQVLIDGRANPAGTGPEAVREPDYHLLAQRVEEAYRRGLSLGLEIGYVLAIDLAKLLRERASGMRPPQADEVLEEVLELLDKAERTYTESGNHPLWEVYEEKAITLMARRRYEDALQIFRSLPEYRLGGDSLRIMAHYAANMTGQGFKAADEPAAQPDSDDLRQRVGRLEQLTAQLVEVLSSGGTAGA